MVAHTGFLTLARRVQPQAGGPPAAITPPDAEVGAPTDGADPDPEEV
jgi:hypothetical protein